jgi:hypothetical protein
MAEDERVDDRAGLNPEERTAGVDDPHALAEQVLADSDARSADRNAAPDSSVEHRRSEDTVEPPPDG